MFGRSVGFLIVLRGSIYQVRPALFGISVMIRQRSIFGHRFSFHRARESCAIHEQAHIPFLNFRLLEARKGLIKLLFRKKSAKLNDHPAYLMVPREMTFNKPD